MGAQGLPFTVFQPLYLYGPYNGKDAMPYFLDRLMRGRPVPIPAPGNQITSLTHIEDLAALLAKAHTPSPPGPVTPVLGMTDAALYAADFKAVLKQSLVTIEEASDQ